MFYEALSLGDKLILGGHCITLYITKFFASIHQQIICPYPPLNAEDTLHKYVLIAAVIRADVVVGVVLLLIKNTTKLKTPLGFGIIFLSVHIALLVHILPLDGRVVIAERYGYIPFIGLALLSAADVQNISKWLRFAFYTVGAVGMIFLTTSRIPDRKNTETIFSELVEKEPYLPLAHNMLGLQHYNNKQYSDAHKRFTGVTTIDPQPFTAHLNIGSIYIHQKKLTKHWSRSIEHEQSTPTHPVFTTSWGGVYTFENK